MQNLLREGVNQMSKYQMTCPKCKYEFTYDNGRIDAQIARLGAEIREIHLWLAHYKTLPAHEKRQFADKYERMKLMLAEKSKESGDLKAIRKVCDQQIQRYELLIWKELVKERFGEAVYKDLLAKVIAELQAYQASGLMAHEYSRKGGKSVTSINKL